MIQNAVFKARVKHEGFEGEDVKAMPLDRIPSLHKIVAMFVQGRPIDASLERHLDYNELECNPVLEKGFDLADYSRVAKENNRTLEELNNEVEQAKLRNKTKQETLQDPSIESPTSVPTE